MNVILSSTITLYKKVFKNLFISIYHVNTTHKLQNYNKESKALFKSE
jgi:hypothetical protein